MAAVTLPNTGLRAGFVEGESGWSANMNRNLRILDAMTNLAVIDKDLSAPPSTPASGDCYIVAASPTGLWTGKAAQIALWCIGSDLLAGEWTFITAKKGLQAYVTDEEKRYAFDGGAWVVVTSGSGGGGGPTDPVDPSAEPDPSGLGWSNALFYLTMEEDVPNVWYQDHGPNAVYVQMGGEVIPTTTTDFKFGTRSARINESYSSFLISLPSGNADLMLERYDTPGSIELWLRLDDVLTERNLIIHDKSDDSSSTNGFKVVVNVGGSITYSQPGTGVTFTTDATCPAGAWCLVRFVKDGAFIRIQINGFSKEGTVAAGLDNLYFATIGSGGMYIDELRWIKGRLTSVDVPAAPWPKSGGLP